MYMLADKEDHLIHPKQLEVGMAAAEPVMVLLVTLVLPVAVDLILELIHNHYMLGLLLPVAVAAVLEQLQATSLLVELVAVLAELTDITQVILWVVLPRQVLVEALAQLKPHLVMAQHVALKLPELSESEVGDILSLVLRLAAAAAGGAAAAVSPDPRPHAILAVADRASSGLPVLQLLLLTLFLRHTI